MHDLKVASPADIAEAWCGGVMHSRDANREALHTLRAYPPPPDVDDPIFVTPDGPDRTMVWHRARGISNPSAMHRLQVYLHERGLCLAPEILFEWARTTEKAQWSQEIQSVVNEAIDVNIEAAETLTDLWERVAEEVFRKTTVLIEARDA